MGDMGIVSCIGKVIKEHKVAVAVALVLMFATSIPLGMAFANSNQDDGKSINYVSIGDSFATGYGLQGSFSEAIYADPVHVKHMQTLEDCGYDVEVEYSYPSVVKQLLENQGYKVSYKQLGQNALRTYDLRVLLDESYPQDGYNRYWYTWENGPWSDLEKLRAEYRTAIEQADIITYDLGKNDFFNFAMYGFIQDAYDHDISNILGDCKGAQYYAMREKIHDLLDRYTGGNLTGEDLVTLEDLVDTFVYAIVGFQVNFEATLDIIRELNPDAQIVVLSLGNIVAGTNLQLGGYTIPVGSIVGLLTDMANMYIVGGSSHADDIIFVDATDESGNYIMLNQEVVDYNRNPNTLSKNFTDMCDVYAPQLALKTNTEAMIRQSAGESFSQSSYDAALMYGYDAIAYMCQQVMKSDSGSLSPFLNGTVSDALDSVVAGFIKTAYSVVNQAYFAEVSGVSAEEAIEKLINDELDVLVNDPESSGIAKLYLGALIGTGYFAHPSPEGHEIIARAIIASLYDEPTTTESYYDMLKSIVNKYKQAFKEYGRPFISKLFDDIADYFKADRASLSTAFAALAGSSDPEEFVDNLMNYLGARNVKGLQALESMLDEAQEYCEQHPELYHVHSMKYVYAQAATCSHAGHKAYWECRTCGKMYSDMFGLHEIDSCDVEIAATEHSWRHVSAVKLFRFTIIPAYDVCTICGARK